MNIALGSDHAGFALKEAIRRHLTEQGHVVLDEGVAAEERVDYPDYGAKVAADVVAGRAAYGIVCCGSGEGICIAANKIPGIRCGIGYNDEVSRLLREHNDANMIAFGGRYMTSEEVLPRVDAFLSASFAGGRHAARVKKIAALERGGR